LFVNGVIVGSASNVTINLNDTSENFAVGYSSNINGIANTFTGAIDDINLYNRELNEVEIQTLASSDIVDYFLTNNLVGQWTFDQFKQIADTFIDKSIKKNPFVVSGNVVFGSEVGRGNASLVFDGTNTSFVSASNESFNTNFMSSGAWINPTESNSVFMEKDGVFTLGLREDRLPELKINGSSTETLKFVKDIGLDSLTTNITFENNVVDQTGNLTNIQVDNVTYLEHADNIVGKKYAVFNGSNTVVNTGKALNQITDPNQMTFGLWVNLQELEEGKSYPLVSVNNGFELYLDKAVNNNTQINFYRATPFDAGVSSFTIVGNVATITMSVTTSTNKTYSAVIFNEPMDVYNTSDIAKINLYASSEVAIVGNGGTAQNVTFTLSKVYTKADSEYNLYSVNAGYLYINVKETEGLGGSTIVDSEVQVYTADSYDFTGVTGTHIISSSEDTYYTMTSKSYFATDTDFASIRIYDINDNTANAPPIQTITLTGNKRNAAMTDNFLLTQDSSEVLIYYRKTDEPIGSQWTLAYTSTNLAGSGFSDYEGDLSDNNVAVIRKGVYVHVFRIIPNIDPTIAPTVNLEQSIDFSTFGNASRPRVYGNTLIVFDTTSFILNIYEYNSSTQVWVLNQTFADCSPGADIYKDTIVCKQNSNKTKLKLFERIGGVWIESQQLTVPSQYNGIYGIHMYENNFVVDNPIDNLPSFIIFTKVDEIWVQIIIPLSQSGRCYGVSLYMNNITIAYWISGTNTKRTYLYQTNAITPGQIQPLPTISTYTYNNTPPAINVSGTLFSSLNEITDTYNLAFSDTINVATLSNDYIIDYVNSNEVSSNVVNGYTPYDILPYTYGITNFISDNTNNTTEPVVIGNIYNIYIVAKDTAGQYGVVHLNSGGVTVKSSSFVVAEDGVGTVTLTLDTPIDVTYDAVVFADQLNVDIEADLIEIKTKASNYGTVPQNDGVDQTVTFTVSTVYNIDSVDTTAYPLASVNKGYLYLVLNDGMENVENTDLVPANSNPVVNIASSTFNTNHYEVQSSVFSSFNTITKIYNPVAFTSNVFSFTLSDAYVIDYAQSNATSNVLSPIVDSNVIANYTYNFNMAFDGSSAIAVDAISEYSIFTVVEDSVGNLGVGSILLDDGLPPLYNSNLKLWMDGTDTNTMTMTADNYVTSWASKDYETVENGVGFGTVTAYASSATNNIDYDATEKGLVFDQTSYFLPVAFSKIDFMVDTSFVCLMVFKPTPNVNSGSLFGNELLSGQTNRFGGTYAISRMDLRNFDTKLATDTFPFNWDSWDLNRILNIPKSTVENKLIVTIRCDQSTNNASTNTSFWVNGIKQGYSTNFTVPGNSYGSLYSSKTGGNPSFTIGNAHYYTGSTPTPNSNTFGGTINEIMYYKELLSDTDVDTLHTYLIAKHNIV
jgi:hypothetical protein